MDTGSGEAQRHGGDEASKIGERRTFLGSHGQDDTILFDQHGCKSWAASLIRGSSTRIKTATQKCSKLDAECPGSRKMQEAKNGEGAEDCGDGNLCEMARDAFHTFCITPLGRADGTVPLRHWGFPGDGCGSATMELNWELVFPPRTRFVPFYSIRENLSIPIPAEICLRHWLL